ncbi:dTDP-4-amino-4,6-dideoxygalactose transaminase [Algoriphagus ratkowskyi]|uniref:dTDP-4-amino-4,6-dideoxygalactose transaminase n=1 Tax=Algoriphagus ratkowskyi TaxID=57028 RepID=A0A2W7RA10_9BACT|nr:dTDP-4-amino-4,6-dideoxygalactose transaminase [Algoriphagus ratkowskyi]PZX57773.1 dTDP-4-amino-4,6-dideoxygalactose transaminase [Algoriphagus ratkowskyi]TXD79037.1 dTDP-4-amino-4,6-dideoxygalactose transaminase [Algoriphagus ratkowskyi]
MIPFNKPFKTGKELEYIADAIASGKISGNGKYTKLCQTFFEEKYGFKKCLLTNSCTDALEMAAILLNIEPGDEVIMPSYTFVSTANAFVLRGAKIRFVDSLPDHPAMDVSLIEELITPRTKAIVVVHYAGVACKMDQIMEIADRHQLFVVEDAAQAIDNYFIDSNGQKKALGSIGHMATFSFHDTKNIISGEGGMLVVSDPDLLDRAEIIWEKGTNRTAFFRGEVAKYSWVDIGSSFLPSEITAAFLWAQLEHMDHIQQTRINIWEKYKEGLKLLVQTGQIKTCSIPDYSTNNAHLFYIDCFTLERRDHIIKELKSRGVWAVFHYLSLHSSEFYTSCHDGRILGNSDHFSNCLLRLPLFVDLEKEDQDLVIDSLISILPK